MVQGHEARRGVSVQKATLLLSFWKLLVWCVYPISEIALICLISGISFFNVIMLFLKEYVLPLGKIRNSYFLSVIKNSKPTRPTKQNQNSTKNPSNYPNTEIQWLIYIEVIFFSFFLIYFSLWRVYVIHWGLGWFVLLLTFRITAGTDVKSEACLFLFTLFLLNLLAVCFQIGFSYLLFFLKWYFDAVFLSAVALDGLVFIGMQESWWGYWSVLVFFFLSLTWSFRLSHLLA